jgi:homoserine O-acetyltransferase
MDQGEPHEILHQSARFAEGLLLDCGIQLPELVVAYRTYGALNAAKSNAILICHALTMDQYIGETHPLTGKGPGWEYLVGPGKPIDTDRYFVMCANVLGGCMGSTGPSDLCSDGRRWGTDFPPITIRDMVRAQKKLVDHFGIERLFAVIGGSMGGMQVLEWAATYPNHVFAAVPIATAAYHSAQNIAFNEVGRQAVFADPDFAGGQYYGTGRIPAAGLGVARMVAHITYLSEEALNRKFGRRLQGGDLVRQGSLALFGDIFQVESYLQHQGSSFVRRFDANSYLTITRAMDYFDIAAEHNGDLSAAFAGTRTRFCVVSFSSDWLFPTAESRAVARALNRAAANVSFVEVTSDKGHDAFLLDEPDLRRILAGFLEGCARHAGLAA